MRWIAALLLITLSGCGVLTWKTVYSSPSPEGKAVVRIEEAGCLGDCAVQVVVRRSWHTTRIAKKSGCVVYFAHAAWSGNVVAVFVDGGYCHDIRVAYDVSSDRTVDFKTVEPWLREAIVRDYRVTAEELRGNSGDVLMWATYPGHCCSRGVDEFRKRYAQ
jgi:hypothetical protein